MERLIEEQEEECGSLIETKPSNVEDDGKKCNPGGGNTSFFPDDFKLATEALD